MVTQNDHISTRGDGGVQKSTPPYACWHSAAGDHESPLACALAALTRPGAHAGCLQRGATIHEALGRPNEARQYQQAAA